MKNITFLLSIFLMSSHAFAGTCTVRVSESNEEVAYTISQKLTAELLSTKNFVITKEKDVGSEKFDFTLDVESESDPHRSFVTLSIQSQKLLNLVSKNPACGYEVVTLMSNEKPLFDSYPATAKALMADIVTCDDLKKIEELQIKSLNCLK